MSQGEKAGEDVKGAFKGLNNISESIRTNINSFADDIVGGNKTHASTGIHPDAKQAGAETQTATEKLGEKAAGHGNTSHTGNASTHAGGVGTDGTGIGTSDTHATGQPVTDQTHPAGGQGSHFAQGLNKH